MLRACVPPFAASAVPNAQRTRLGCSGSRGSAESVHRQSGITMHRCDNRFSELVASCGANIFTRPCTAMGSVQTLPGYVSSTNSEPPIAPSLMVFPHASRPACCCRAERVWCMPPRGQRGRSMLLRRIYTARSVCVTSEPVLCPYCDCVRPAYRVRRPLFCSDRPCMPRRHPTAHPSPADFTWFRCNQLCC